MPATRAMSGLSIVVIVCEIPQANRKNYLSDATIPGVSMPRGGRRNALQMRRATAGIGAAFSMEL